MRKPSSLSPWFTVEQLVAWVKESPNKTAYQRRLAIWLTHARPFAAHHVPICWQFQPRRFGSG
jgi:hypothetical protein